MKTPCVKVCVMDPRRDVCLGCCRSLDEIAAWGGMTDEERERIIAVLPERKRRLDVPEVAVPPLS